MPRLACPLYRRRHPCTATGRNVGHEGQQAQAHNAIVAGSQISTALTQGARGGVQESVGPGGKCGGPGREGVGGVMRNTRVAVLLQVGVWGSVEGCCVWRGQSVG